MDTTVLDIDSKRITPVVKKFFNKEFQRARLIKMSIGDVSSPSLDGMPKGTAKSDSMTNQMLRSAEALKLLDDVDKALSRLTDEQREVIVRRLIRHQTVVKTSLQMVVSQSTEMRLLRQAEVSFAYAFRGGQLLDSLQ